MIQHPPELDDLIERYLDRGLSEEEERAWEEHYLSCESCFQQLRQAKVIREFLLEQRDWRRAEAPAPGTRVLDWVQRLFRPAGWRPALGSAFVVATMVLAVRGLVLERRYDTDLAALEAPFAVETRFAVGTRRVAGEPTQVRRPDSGSSVLVSFTLLEPTQGADTFRLTLKGPSGHPIWRDLVEPRGMTTQISLVLRSAHLAPGEHRVIVEELRTSDDKVLDSYEVPFLVEDS